VALQQQVPVPITLVLVQKLALLLEQLLIIILEQLIAKLEELIVVDKLEQQLIVAYFIIMV